MSALALLCAAAAVSVGPRPHAHLRFQSLFTRPGSVARRSDRRRWVVPAGAAGVGAATLTGSAAVVAATVIAAAVLGWLARRSFREHERLAREEAVLRALGVVVAELSVGAPTAAACATAGAELLADDSASPVGRDLATLAAHIQLGGEVGAAPAGAAAPVADLWTTAGRFGLPLAELLGARRADLVARRRFATHTAAGLAGPRATARVLALLPVFGLALGQGIGADPIRVLLAPGMGSVLLVTGTALAAAGVVWSEHIVDRVLT